MRYDHYERMRSARRIQLIGTRLSVTALMFCALVGCWELMMDSFDIPWWKIFPISTEVLIFGTLASIGLSVVIHILVCFFSWLSGN